VLRTFLFFVISRCFFFPLFLPSAAAPIGPVLFPLWRVCLVATELPVQVSDSFHRVLLPSSLFPSLDFSLVFFSLPAVEDAVWRKSVSLTVSFLGPGPGFPWGCPPTVVTSFFLFSFSFAAFLWLSRFFFCPYSKFREQIFFLTWLKSSSFSCYCRF